MKTETGEGKANSKKPFFSVVIPTFNRWPLVGEAIESVLGQTFTDYELIVVDDGSTDGTADNIVRDFPNVTLIKQDNRGVSSARNVGIHNSSADWVTFLDSDDMWEPNKLSQQREAIIADPSIRIIHTDEKWIRNKKRVNPKNIHQKSGSVSGDNELFRRSVKMCLISPSSVAIHAELFDKVGLFDESLPVCEDYDLWLRIMAGRSVAYIDEKLVIKRNDDNPGCEATQLSKSTWGLDRYRVRSLRKILDSGVLTSEQADITLNEIARKSSIISKGSAIRGHKKRYNKYCALEKWAIDMLERRSPGKPSPSSPVK